MQSYWVVCSSAYFSRQNLERCLCCYFSLPLSEGMQHFCDEHLTPESHSDCVHLTGLYCSHWQNGDLLTFHLAVFYVFGEFLVTWGIWLSYSFHSMYCPAYTNYVFSLKSLGSDKMCCSQGLPHALSNWSTVSVQFKWSQLTHLKTAISIACHVDSLMYFMLGNLPNKILIEVWWCWNTAFPNATQFLLE